MRIPRPGKPLTQKGLLTVILILALAVFALVNACAALLAGHYGLSIDMTEERLYELSDVTRDVCASLAEDTVIRVLSAQNEYPEAYREILSRYGRLSDRLEILYTDPADNPLLISHYQQTGLELRPSDLLVSGAERTKAVAYRDTLVYDGDRPSGIDIEQQLTAAILYVNSVETPLALFTSGHGERASESLKKLFSSNNFTTGNVALGVEALGSPAVVVAAAPAYDFAPRELDLLSAYLAGGGRLMVFAEPSPTPLPNLKAFLAGWGMTLEDDVVFEEKAYASGSPGSIIPLYAPHPVNAVFESNRIYAVLPATRSITLSSPAPNLARVAPLLISTGDAYAKTDLSFISAAKAAGDLPGPFVMAAVAEKGTGEGRAAVFLAGSRLIYADDLLSAGSYANRLFLTRAVAHLWENASPVSIPHKALGNDPLPVTRAQGLTWGLLLSALLPAAALAAGAAVKIRRNRL